MSYNPYIHHRRSIRLEGYDYSSEGMYFVTICTFQHKCIFGSIVGATGGSPSWTTGNQDLEQQMVLTQFGQIAYDEWYLSAEIRKEIELDVFVVMPNHVHGIVIINSSDSQDLHIDHVPGDPPVAPTGIGNPDRLPRGPKAKSLASFIAGYKSSVTRKIVKLSIQDYGVGATGGSPESRIAETEPSKIWQRNYHEHIIRNIDSYTKISEYILNNPANWPQDKFFK